jgi:hypothetical protein
MSTTRRRHVLRPSAPTNQTASRRLPALRTRLEREQEALSRWMTRLKRAFHSFEKLQQRTARLEKQIRTLEES